MWESDRSALTIISGEELLRFDLGTVEIGRTTYTVLTGYEMTGRCWWCGGEIKQGKRSAKYCRFQNHYAEDAHFRLYWKHFEWASARNWCIKRYNNCCANCGQSSYSLNLEVHHIIPINGGVRFFSVYNLPWNLILLCHDCHQLIHSAIREATMAERKKTGQGFLRLF